MFIVARCCYYSLGIIKHFVFPFLYCNKWVIWCISKSTIIYFFKKKLFTDPNTKHNELFLYLIKFDFIFVEVSIKNQLPNNLWSQTQINCAPPVSQKFYFGFPHFCPSENNHKMVLYSMCLAPYLTKFSWTSFLFIKHVRNKSWPAFLAWCCLCL